MVNNEEVREYSEDDSVPDLDIAPIFQFGAVTGKLNPSSNQHDPRYVHSSSILPSIYMSCEIISLLDLRRLVYGIIRFYKAIIKRPFAFHLNITPPCFSSIFSHAISVVTKRRVSSAYYVADV